MRHATMCSCNQKASSTCCRPSNFRSCKFKFGDTCVTCYFIEKKTRVCETCFLANRTVDFRFFNSKERRGWLNRTKEDESSYEEMKCDPTFPHTASVFHHILEDCQCLDRPVHCEPSYLLGMCNSRLVYGKGLHCTRPAYRASHCYWA